MDQQFLVELAKRIKRHPQSYPSWVVQLAEDVTLTDNAIRVQRREFVPPPDGSVVIARQVLSGET